MWANALWAVVSYANSLTQGNPMWVVFFAAVFVALVFVGATKKRPISRNRPMTAVIGMALSALFLVGFAILYWQQNPRTIAYPYLVPQIDGNYPTSIRLLVWNSGNEELRGIKVTIRNFRDYGGSNSAFFNKPSIDVGTLGPRGFSEFEPRISPDLNERGEDTWIISTQAHTGMFTESLEIRKGINGTWAYRYSITDHTAVLTNPAAPQPIIKKSEWSDGSH